MEAGALVTGAASHREYGRRTLRVITGGRRRRPALRRVENRRDQRVLTSLPVWRANRHPMVARPGGRAGDG
jgi:hypothetical protein